MGAHATCQYETVWCGAEGRSGYHHLPRALGLRGSAPRLPPRGHCNTVTDPNAQWAAQQIVEVFPSDQAHRFLLRDRDGVYDHQDGAGQHAFYRQIIANVDSSDSAEIREIIEEETRHEQTPRQARQGIPT